MAGVRRARALEPEPGRLRVVFDLDGDVRHRSFVLADPFRVLVDFDARASLTESRQGPVIVLDPGHGGRDRGARSAGASEAHLALDIARRARRVLRRRIDRARVLLTRDGDDFVSLEQRTAMANAAEADLFVSIHLNASDEPIEHGGVASFVLDTSDDEQALRLAARENGTTKEQVTGLSRLVAGLHRDRQVSASRGVARRLQASVVRGGRSVLPQLADRGVKEALFYVLVGARMPAVLVEASFLSHPEEARALQTERYRQALAEGLAHGIEVALEP
jgi:N-acetylmuramoyl-L-alanine amidase